MILLRSIALELGGKTLLVRYQNWANISIIESHGKNQTRTSRFNKPAYQQRQRYWSNCSWEAINRKTELPLMYHTYMKVKWVSHNKCFITPLIWRSIHITQYHLVAPSINCYKNTIKHYTFTVYTMPSVLSSSDIFKHQGVVNPITNRIKN